MNSDSLFVHEYKQNKVTNKFILKGDTTPNLNANNQIKTDSFWSWLGDVVDAIGDALNAIGYLLHIPGTDVDSSRRHPWGNTRDWPSFNWFGDIFGGGGGGSSSGGGSWNTGGGGGSTGGSGTYYGGNTGGSGSSTGGYDSPDGGTPSGWSGDGGLYGDYLDQNPVYSIPVLPSYSDYLIDILNITDPQLIDFLNGRNADIGQDLVQYLDINGESQENKDFVLWALDYLMGNSGFDYNILFSTNEFSGINNMPTNITEEPLINNGIEVSDLPDNTPQNQNRIIGSAPKRHGNNPEDLQFGSNGNVSGIYSPLINKSDAELFSSMRNLLWKTSVLSPDMRSVTTQMADRFESNIGGEFVNATLTQNVKLSVQYQNFLKTFGERLSERLTALNGNINQVDEINTNAYRPIFNGFWNKFAGLQISMNDTESNEIKLLNFRTDHSNLWYADVEVTIYDNYGLDKADALKYQGKHLGFAAWWLLQHTRGYKPFVTKVVIKSRINGRY